MSIFQSLPDATKRALLQLVTNNANPIAATDATTKNDKIRLLELRAWNLADKIWSKALGTFDRQELDAAHSHESVETAEKLDAFHRLSNIYNHRVKRINNNVNETLFAPYNRVCLYNELGEKLNENANPDIYDNEVFKALSFTTREKREMDQRYIAWVQARRYCYC